jgi:GT2 family glycosyltransferase
MNASIVVPTRDRPSDLERCVEALLAQRTTRAYEIVVVDDGPAESRIPHEGIVRDPIVRVVRSEGRGPAAARNLGVREASADIILFTDDDAEPAPGWLDAACSFLDAHPEYAGVEGPTISPPFDYLFAYSVESSTPGAYWTCNVAYRRSVLLGLGGFWEEFPWPHCEDLDLAFRALRLGPIGFEKSMRVTHHPRAQSVSALVRRARFAPSELVLAQRHPDRYAGRTPLGRVTPALGVLRHWRRMLVREGLRLLTSPRRFVRFWVVALGQIGASLLSLLTTNVGPRGNRQR